MLCKKCKEPKTTGARAVLESHVGLEDQRLSPKIKKEPAPKAVALEHFLALFPRRDKYIERLPGKDWQWRDRLLHDYQIAGVISDEGRGLFRGCAWAHKTRFAVFDIDPGSRYQTVQELQKLTALLAAVGLTAKPYQSSSRGGWHLYQFFDEWADSDEVKNTLKAWLKAYGYKIKGGTLEVFPSGNGLRFPLQTGFGWLNQNGKLTKRREELELDEALASFLTDMETNARNWSEAKRRIDSQLFSAGTSAGAGAQEREERVTIEGLEQLYTRGLDHELYQRGREYWLNGLTASGQRHDAIVSIGHYLWYGDVSLGLRALPSPRNAGARADLISAWLREKHNGQSKTINAGGWCEVQADIESACSWSRQDTQVREKESYPLTDRLVNRLVETKTLTPEDFAKANRRKEGAARAKILRAFRQCIDSGEQITRNKLAEMTGCSPNTVSKHGDIWMLLTTGSHAYRGAGGRSGAASLSSVGCDPEISVCSGAEIEEKDLDPSSFVGDSVDLALVDPLNSSVSPLLFCLAKSLNHPSQRQDQALRVPTAVLTPGPWGWFSQAEWQMCAGGIYLSSGVGFIDNHMTGALAMPFYPFLDVDAVIDSEKSLPTLNAATRLARISMTAPVLGLRPERAKRLRASNVPKPTRVTFSPLATDLIIASMVRLMICSASFLVVPASLATTSTRSALFKCECSMKMQV